MLSSPDAVIDVGQALGEAAQADKYDTNYNPIVKQFHRNNDCQLRALWSPFGSGTSSASFYELGGDIPSLSVPAAAKAQP